jgi:hypothetical protein
MIPQRKKLFRNIILVALGGLFLLLLLAGCLIMRTRGRTLIQVDIHQNKELIYLSAFAEPPQFAVWLENPGTGDLKNIFVTRRVATGDWEGKANVPVALPQWFRLFRENDNPSGSSGKADDLVISGATPKADYFSVRVEVKPESEWICWIEMNLAGDFNEAFPEFDPGTFREDEFGNGQPALLFKTEVRAVEKNNYTAALWAQAVWNDGSVKIEPVSEGVTTARYVFDTINVSILRPKPKLIDKYKIREPE